MTITGYASSGRSYVAIADSAGTLRDLSPWLEQLGPLGQVIAARDVTGVNDAAARTAPGPAAAQEFTLAGRWDDSPNISPDAVLSTIVGRSVTVEYGPAGNSKGQRKVSGQFLCLAYQIASQAGKPVRFTATFRQNGPATLGEWS